MGLLLLQNASCDLCRIASFRLFTGHREELQDAKEAEITNRSKVDLGTAYQTALPGL
jgi:hypothetical protein